MQWEGPGVHAMNMDDRMTIANMAIEAGGKNGIFPYDEKTGAYVRERVAENGTKSDFEPVELDREQTFVYDKTFDLSQARADRRVPSRSRPAQAREGTEQREARPRLHRLVHGRKDERLPRVRARRERQDGEDRHVRRARDDEGRAGTEGHAVGRRRASGASSKAPACA